MAKDIKGGVLEEQRGEYKKGIALRHPHRA
jgi:hypothetical protein